MADFNYCINFVLDNEDRTRACAVVPDPPPGSFALSGINSHYWPDDFARISALPQSERLPAVIDFYRVNFWNDWLEQMVSDDLTARVLDSRVNQGAGTATRLLQQAVNAIGGIRIGEDVCPHLLANIS